jgi:hypothetical protein
MKGTPDKDHIYGLYDPEGNGYTFYATEKERDEAPATMTNPMQKITALCEKHGFTCWPQGRLIIVFDRVDPPTKFEIFGNLEQIYQKFLAVLQAMGWEPPTPTGIKATAITPGPDWYEVIDATSYDALKVGDRVQMVETPIEYDNFLYRSDGTLHNLQKADGNYFTLISKPLPTFDAPASTFMQFNINDSVQVKLTDYGRDILRQKQDSRHSLERVDAQGYTRFQLWELMNIFGSHIYNGATRQCFDANIVLLEFPQL